MKIDGMDAVGVRSSLFGVFAIVPGGHGGYGVYCKYEIVPDGSPAKFKHLLEPEIKLFICGTLREAQTRQAFEACKHKQYRRYGIGTRELRR